MDWILHFFCRGSGNADIVLLESSQNNTGVSSCQSLLSDQIVWDKSGVCTCRACAAISPPLTGIFEHHSWSSQIGFRVNHPILSRLCGDYVMGSVPNADHDLLCSLNENSLIYLYCSTETPFSNAFPTAPGDPLLP